MGRPRLWVGRERISRLRFSGKRSDPGSSESRHPSQPPAPPSCCLELHELPSEGMSDASLQIASVSSDRRAQALMRLPPFCALGRVSQRTLDFRIRLMSWTRPWPRRPPVRAAAVPRRTRRRAGPSGREPQSNRLRMPASTRSMVSRQSPPWGDGSNAVRTDEIRCL